MPAPQFIQQPKFSHNRAEAGDSITLTWAAMDATSFNLQSSTDNSTFSTISTGVKSPLQLTAAESDNDKYFRIVAVGTSNVNSESTTISIINQKFSYQDQITVVDSVSDLPLASKFGVGVAQVGDNIYVSNGSSWSLHNNSYIVAPSQPLPDFHSVGTHAALQFRNGMRHSGSDYDGKGSNLDDQGVTGTYNTETGYAPQAAGTGKALRDNQISVTSNEAGAMVTSGYTIGFSVSKDVIDANTLPAGTRYIGGNAANYIEVRSESSQRRCRFYNDAIGEYLNAFFCLDDKPDLVPILQIARSTEVDIYVDSLHIGTMPRTTNSVFATAQTQYRSWYFGGLTIAATGYPGTSIADAFLLSQPVTVNSILTKVGILGSSFYSNAGPALYFSSPLFAGIGGNADWYPGQGFQGDGITPVVATNVIASTGTQRADTGVICQIFRTLAKNGFFPTNNRNRSVSGGTVNGDGLATATTAIYQFRQMIADGYVPELVFCNLGTNEAAAATFKPNLFESAYKQLLLEMYAAGVTGVVIQEILSLGADAVTYADPKYEAAVVRGNQIINGLVEWAKSNCPGMGVAIDPCYFAFGGPNVNTSLFQSSNIHPNAIGSSKLGVSAGETAVKMLMGLTGKSYVGTGIIANGQSTVVINHGQRVTPRYINLQSGNTEGVWATSAGSTTFTVNRTGTTGANTFYWEAIF